MPTIKSSADLRNNYNEISTFCHNYPEPVFITKNGKGDLAVMSIEAYEELTSRFELYSKIKEGMDDIASGNTRPFADSSLKIQLPPNIYLMQQQNKSIHWQTFRKSFAL